MAKLIRYRIIAAVQFFLVFFFMMLVSDYTQYDAEMFNLKINTIYEREYDYLDCRVSDGITQDDLEFDYFKLQTYMFYVYYQFDLQSTDDLSKDLGSYLNPTCLNKLPEDVKWIMGGTPHTPDQIVLGEDLFNLINNHCDEPITVGSTIRVKINTLASNSTFAPFEAVVAGVYSADFHVFSPVLQNRQMINQTNHLGYSEEYVESYNPLNESFFLSHSVCGGLVILGQASPVRTMVEIPKEKDSLVKLYHENHRVRSCIDSFEVDNSNGYLNGYKSIANLVGHKKYLEISMIIFGIICAFAVPLLVLFLFAATQLAIIRNEDKPITNIFVKELIFYSLILLGGGLIYTIYTIIFPWVLLVKPILISTFSFAGILLLNWLLIFIWKYKELSKE